MANVSMQGPTEITAVAVVIYARPARTASTAYVLVNPVTPLAPLIASAIHQALIAPWEAASAQPMHPITASASTRRNINAVTVV